MGLAVVATSVPTKTFRSDAVEEMAPALTEPLSQSKLSSSAASGASPRTSSSTTTTATVTATLGGTTILPVADEQQLQEVVDNHPEQVAVQQGQHLAPAVDGFVESVPSAPTIPLTLQGQEESTLDGMGMSLPVTSGDGGSTTVDDIQNNNNAGGGQSLLKQLEQENTRDLVEIALEQLHHDTTLAGSEVAAGVSVVVPTTMDPTIMSVGGVVGMGSAPAPVDAVPGNVMQPPVTNVPQHSDFILMDTPVVMPPVTFQELQPTPQQPATVGSMGQHQELPSTSSLGVFSGVGGMAGGVGGSELSGLMKETGPDMDQMIRDISTGEIDLLQVLKSFENNSLLLFSDVDVLCDVGPTDGRDGNVHPSSASPSTSPNKDRERIELHVEMAKRQAHMQRKYDFLVRRLHKLIARYMGQHVSEEVAGLFEHTQRYWKKREKEHAKQMHNNSSSVSGTRNPAPTSGGGGGTAGANEKWPDIIPFQAPPPDTTPAPPEKLKPISANALKTFAKRMEGISSTICSVQSKSVLHNRYFQGVSSSGQKTASSVVPPASASTVAGGGADAGGVYANISNTIPLFDRVATQELEQTAGLLHAELRHVQNTIDSDATLSSSGGDSADESMPYVNALQEPLTITERATWKWSKDRAAVASRWTWLVARIADLEYRIRQHGEVLNKIRTKKGAVVLEEPVSATITTGNNPEDPQQPPQSINGYRGQLPGSSKPLDTADPTSTTTVAATATGDDDDLASSCSRVKPYCRLPFRKRKLLPTHNLHVISKRAARPSNFKCGCQWPLNPCALCTGRQDPTAPRDPLDTMPFAERVALLDPCYHSVLSFPEDISHSVHLEAIMRLPEWQNKMIRSTPVAIAAGSSASHKTAGTSGLPASANRPGGRVGDTNSSIFSSGDETVPSSHGKRYTASDGKRKHSSSINNKYKSGNITDGGNKPKKAKSRRDVILQNNRKQGYPLDGSRTGPNGQSRNHKNKSRKSSHSYEYFDGHDGGVSRSKNSSPTPNYQRNERRPRNSYDIDNIVIPYSMAAATRVSLPQYKDIPIPKWCVVDDNDESAARLPTEGDAAKHDPATDTSQCSTSSSTVSATERVDDDDKQPILKRPNEPSIPPNGTKTIKTPTPASITVSSSVHPAGYTRKEDPSCGKVNEPQTVVHHQQQLFVMPALDEEDISDEAIMLKHERALQEERKKFRTYMKFPWSRPRANRRTESRAGSSGGNTPDPTSPAPPTPMVEHDSSPACPSTPLTPLDGQELSAANVIHALNNSLSKKERRRTVSSKRDEQNHAAGVGAGSTTPDTREVVSPYESLQFPLPDDIFEDMVRSMPNDHIAMVEDCISKLTGRDGLPLRRSRHRNNNVLLMLKSSAVLAPASLGLGRHNPLSSSASCSSTTMSATEADLEEFDDEDLMLAKRTENQLIMERLLNSRGESQQYEIVPPTAKPMLGDDDEEAMDDEETDTGESVYVEEDDPNDPEWHDRPPGGYRAGAAGGGGTGRV